MCMLLTRRAPPGCGASRTGEFHFKMCLSPSCEKVRALSSSMDLFRRGLHLCSCSFAHQILVPSSTSTSWQHVPRCQYFPEQEQGKSACLSWPSAFELLSKVAPGNFICGTLFLAAAELLLLSVEAETNAPPKFHWSCRQITGLVLLSDQLPWFVPYRHEYTPHCSTGRVSVILGAAAQQLHILFLTAQK